jgi:hypothetical protein
MRLDRIPASVAFCDVETTGLANNDRIVSFGAIGMMSSELAICADRVVATLPRFIHPGAQSRMATLESPPVSRCSAIISPSRRTARRASSSIPRCGRP